MKKSTSSLRVPLPLNPAFETVHQQYQRVGRLRQAYRAVRCYAAAAQSALCVVVPLKAIQIQFAVVIQVLLSLTSEIACLRIYVKFLVGTQLNLGRSKNLTLFGYPPWVVMWSWAAAIFFACKLLTLRGVDATWWWKLAYLVAWPGMNATAFCTEKLSERPTVGELFFSLIKTAFGLTLLLIAVPNIESVLIRGWVGMVGIIFVLHFGTFHFISWCWRRAGVNAKPLMDWPILATSLSDFWGRRWNVAFRDLTHRFLFRPLASRLGGRLGLAVGFLASGIVHDVVISVPAGGGYGLPTLYFVLQGAGLLLERAYPKIRGRALTMAVLLLPAYGLFHPPFVLNVIVPFLDWIQSPTWAVRSLL